MDRNYTILAVLKDGSHVVHPVACNTFAEVRETMYFDLVKNTAGVISTVTVIGPDSEVAQWTFDGSKLEGIGAANKKVQQWYRDDKEI